MSFLVLSTKSLRDGEVLAILSGDCYNFFLKFSFRSLHSFSLTHSFQKKKQKTNNESGKHISVNEQSAN